MRFDPWEGADMTVSSQVAGAVDKILARGGRFDAPIEVSAGPLRLVASLGMASPVGVLCHAIEVLTGQGERSLEELRAWGDRIAARLSYLTERLVLLETDSEAGQALLRSHLPASKDNTRAYYEIRLWREGKIRLVRVVFHESERKRQEEPFQLTREVFERVCDDLVEP
jgi:hypothetical protein